MVQEEVPMSGDSTPSKRPLDAEGGMDEEYAAWS